MSEIITAKAGGTSNRDSEAVLQSMEWAEKADIFVVSAPGELDTEETVGNKVTDLLLKTRREYLATGNLPEEELEAITSRYSSIVSEIGKVSLPKNWVDNIPARIEKATREEATRHSEDTVSMLGERLQAEIYEAHGYTLLDPGRSPVNLGSNPDTWRQWLGNTVEKGKKYVLPGNTTLVNGRLVTFSRGGSDTSVGCAAYGINADLNLKLTDDSALSADPRLVQPVGRATRIAHLLYEEGRELGRNGTGLVHPAAMVPLMIGNIPTEIRSTFNLDASPTVLDNDAARAQQRAGKVVALSLMENVTMHRIHEPGMAEAIGRLATFETALSDSSIAIVDSQGDGVDRQKYFVETGKAEQALEALSGVTKGRIESSGNLSFITLVGYRLERKLFKDILNLAHSSGTKGEVWQAEGHDFSLGKNSLRISANPGEARELLNALHASFIENTEQYDNSS